jgi:hypothetical protein
MVPNHQKQDRGEGEEKESQDGGLTHQKAGLNGRREHLTPRVWHPFTVTVNGLVFM